MQWLKGRTAHHLLAEFPHPEERQFWGRHLWARGYFCCSSGTVPDDVIAKYIAEQNVDQDEDFRAMVAPSTFLKPAWCGKTFVGLRPEQGRHAQLPEPPP